MLYSKIKVHGFVFISILALSVLLYANNLRGEFVFDDVSYVTGREDIRSLKNILSFFTAPYSFHQPQTGAYRPMVIASIAFNYALFGFHTTGYHVTNIVLHAFVGIMVFILGTHLLKSKKAAVGVSLLFLTYPIHTEVVNSVVNRSEALSAFFGLTALFFALQKPKVWQRVLSAIFLLFALFSKESSIVFFPIIFFYGFPKIARDHIKEQILYSVNIFLTYSPVLTLYFYLRYIALGKFIFSTNATMVENPLRFTSLSERTATSLGIFVRYIWKLLFPFHLSADYSFNQIPIVSFNTALVFLGALFLVLINIMIVQSFLSDKKLMLTLSLFLFPYLVTSNIFFPVGTIMAERLLYLPSIGFLLFGAYVMQKKALKTIKKHTVVLFVFFISIWIIRVWIRNVDWNSQRNLFLKTAQTSPNSVLARSNAGAMYLLSNELENAKQETQRANEIYDKYPHAVNNLGLIFVQEGRLREAEEQFRKTLNIDPMYENAVVNVARTLLYQGKYEELVSLFQPSYQAEPLPFSFYKAVGYAMLSQFSEVKKIIDTQLFSTGYGVAYLQGLIAFQQKEFTVAKKQFEVALRNTPVDGYLIYGLGLSYAKLNQTEDAKNMAGVLKRSGNVLFDNWAKEILETRE